MYKSENLFADKVPTCTCGGFIKPDIVFFGESLPEKYWQLSKEVVPFSASSVTEILTLHCFPFYRIFPNVIC